MTAAVAPDASITLAPYVPRVVLEWAADGPEERYRPLEGSLAFCDLSGFTAMSEKLATLGRQGAEELSDVLNTIFGALLGDAAAFGGSMLKYGGDAILVFFWGDGHAARASAACHRMRATLRRVGTVRTAGGTVRVRMSVGVHSGTFDAFLVGESHRELLVCGVGATTTCAMETAADAGEILLSAATAALLPPASVGARKGDGFLLRRSPPAEERSAEAWGGSPDVDPSPYVPAALRTYLRDGPAEPEHRHVTVAFIAFGGVDTLLQERGAVHVAGVLDAFVAACQRAFDRFGVCFLTADVYGDGGKVIATTGAPLAYEDNEERILRAVREIATAEQGLALHVGVNRGYVFAGDVGPPFRRTYTILGDAVNTAARVMASCTEHNQVRAMPDVVERALTRFDAVKQPPFAAKGKALPLVTVAVGEPRGLRTEVVRPPLVGRDAEVAQLHRIWGEIGAGHGGAVVITGDAGTGKTRLLDELAAHAEAAGAVTLTTHAERYERDTPYFVLRQLLATVLGVGDGDDARAVETAVVAAAPDLAPWVPLIGQVLGVAMPPSAAIEGLDERNVPARLAEITVSCIASAVAGPAAWLVDNADFADAASVAVLRAVVPLLANRPWGLALAQRSHVPVVDAEASRVVSAKPLNHEDAALLARAIDPRLLPHDAAVVAERSGGNPMFLRQLIAAGVDGAVMADSVETAVGARIDALAPVDRTVLRTAAVLGGRFQPGALRELVDGGRAPDLGALSDFIARTEGGDYVFRQALYREVAYAGLTYKRRRALHHAAGRALEASAPGDAGRLSLHFHEAHDWERSWRYSRAAGDRAYTSAAKPVAVTFYERALEAGRRAGAPPTEVAAVANELGQALYFAGRVDAAERAYRRAAALAPPGTVVAASAAHRMGVVLLETNRVRSCQRWLRRGFQELGDTRGPDAVDVLVGLHGTEIALAYRRGDLNAALLAAERAVAAAAAGDDSDRGQAHQILSLTLGYAGRLDEAVEHARTAINHLQRTSFRGLLGDAYNALGTLLAQQGHWGAAAGAYEAAREAFIAAGNAALESLATANQAEILIDQGRFAEAQPMVAESLRVLRLARSQFTGFVLALAARIAARDPLAQPTMPEFATDEDPLGYAAVGPVEVALARGDGHAALTALDRAEGTPLLLRAALLRGLALRLTGDPAASASLQAAADGDAEDAFGAALARIALGRGVEAEPVLRELGVVALPRWLAP